MDYRGYTITIEQDEMAESPIEYNDSRIHTMMFMKRYWLGDKHGYADMDEMVEDYAKILDYDKYAEIDDKFEDGEIKLADYWKAIRRIFFDNVVYQNIYAYVHGGIILSTTPFNDIWDSGQVGIIFVAKKDVPELFNGDHEKAKLSLVEHIKEYNHWVNGDCWIATIVKDGEELGVQCRIGDYDEFEKELKLEIDKAEETE